MPENNLDPDQARMTNDALMEMQRAVAMLSASLGGSSARFNANSAAVDSNTKSAQEATKERRAASKTWADSYAAQERWNTLAKGAGNSLISLSNATLATGTTLSKFSGTVDSVGRTMSTFASSFGTVGKVIGLMIEAYTAVTKKTLEYGDNILAAKDGLAAFGASGKFTSQEIMDLGKKAGYTSATIKGWTAAVKTLGTDIIGLSASVNGGVLEFGKLSEMTMEQRENYQALGMSQEDVTQAQADYIKLQVMTGRSLNDQLKTQNGLRKAADEYIVNLNTLAGITGLTIDQAKEVQRQAASHIEFNLRMQALELEKFELAGKNDAESVARRKAIDAEVAGSNKLMLDAQLTGDKTHAANMAHLIGSGGIIDSSNSALLYTSRSAQELLERAKKNEYKEGEAFTDYIKSQSRTIKDFGPTAGALSPDLRKATGMGDLEGMRTIGKYLGKDMAEMYRLRKIEVEKAVAGETPAKNQDAAGLARQKVMEITQAYQAAMDAANARQLEDLKSFLILLEKQAKVYKEVTDAVNGAMKALGSFVGFLNDWLGPNGLLIAGIGSALAVAFGPQLAVMIGKGIWGAFKTAIAAPVATTVAEGAAKAALPVATKVAEGGAAAVKPGFLMSAEEKIAERAARQAADAAKLAGAESTTLGKMAGPMGKVSNVAGKLAVPLAVGAGVYQAATGYNEAAEKERKGEITHAEGNIQKGGAIGEGAGTAGGGLAGASIGAAIGTAIVPVIGTAIGGLVGGLIGAYGGGKLGKEVGKVGGDLLTDKDKKDKESDKDVNMKLTGSFVEMTKVTLAFTNALKEASDALGGMSTGGVTGGTAGGTAGGGGGGRGGGDATGSTSGNGQTAMEKAMAAGYTKEQAAGLVGNLQQESGMNPTARNEREGTQGIAQWRGERLEAFKKKYGKEVMYATLDEQMDFVLHELETTEKKAGNLLKNAKTAAEAAAIVDKFYERSAGTELAKRIANANAIAGKQAIDAANAAATKLPVATAVPAKEEPIITITPTAEFKETSAANTPGKSTVAKTKKKAVAPEHLSGDKGGSAGINLAVPGASSEGIAGEAEAKPAKTGFADKVKSILSMIDLSPKEKGTSKYPIKHTVPKSGDGPSRDFYGAEAIAARAAAKKERESTEAAASVAEDNRKKEVQAEENRKFAEQRAAIKVAIAEGNGNKGPAKTPADIDPKTLLPRTQKLAKGGIVSNTSSGSTVTLGDGPPGHKEAAIPLDPSSIVHKLIQPGSAETLNKASDTMPIPAPVASPMSDMTSGLTVEMVEMLSQKLDTMIDKLSSGNDTQDKILMYSRA